MISASVAPLGRFIIAITSAFLLLRSAFCCLPAIFFGWRAFFAGLAFLAVVRFPFGCGALASGVSAVSIVSVFIGVSP
jgi:hypothetical protein